MDWGGGKMNRFFRQQIFLGLLLLGVSLQANESSRQRYLELVRQYPQFIQPQGDADQGEIEILIDEEKMAAIEERCGRDVGVLKEDRYWIWVNDACKFPNGREGVYGRIFWIRGLESFSQGVAVMPMTSEGKIVLNCNFRHSTRCWEIELPRGVVNKGETAEAAARREAREETGRMIGEMNLLGEVPPDTGVLSVTVPVFVAHVTDVGLQELEDSEAIEGILELSIEEAKRAFSEGYYECTLRGTPQRVHFRDPFLAYALLRL